MFAMHAELLSVLYATLSFACKLCDEKGEWREWTAEKTEIKMEKCRFVVLRANEWMEMAME